MKSFLSVNHSHLVRGNVIQGPWQCYPRNWAPPLFYPFSGRKRSSSWFFPKKWEARGDIPNTSWGVEFLVYSKVFNFLADKARINLHGYAGLEPLRSEKALGRTASRLRTGNHRSHLKWSKVTRLKGCTNFLHLDFINYRLLFSLVCEWVHSKNLTPLSRELLPSLLYQIRRVSSPIYPLWFLVLANTNTEY